MKVLMISTDRKLFQEGSGVYSRMIKYGELFDELHVVVFSLSKLQLEDMKISPKVTLYPTNTFTKLGYILKAVSIGKSILGSSKEGWVISSQDPFETGIVGVILSGKKEAKLQLQMHGDFWSPYYKGESLLNKIRLQVAKYTIPKADCIRVVSKRIQKSLREEFNISSNVSVLPIADFSDTHASEAKFNVHEKYPQFDFIVLMASRLESVKNIELAICSFADVVKKDKKAGLIIVGDGSLSSDLKALSMKLNLTENVIFIGWQEDISSYLLTSDLFLNTSNHEGYCLSLIEAAGAKCPVLTTDVGVVGEILNESNILICPVGDKECFEEQVCNGINNREALSKMGDTAFIDITSNSNTKEYYLQSYKDSFELCST